ncbi:MAG: GntR family transcriptional regulator [Gammaproteobacteria bacterium]|nr:GntR family transcriptional regulator [Gammaproteobacteria bacterium]
MNHIGRTNNLEIINMSPNGALLDAEKLGKILLPNRYLPENCKVGDFINAFIYFDSKQRLTATTQRVKAEVGNVAFLKVKQANQAGAFLDWGLSKDLFVPLNQQQISMTVNKSYLVYVYFDKDSNRIVASSRLNRFIEHNASNYTEGQAVELSISDITDLGYSAVINNQHWGLLFFADVVNALKIGQRLKGYIKQIRDDGKINLSLEARGYEKVISLSTKILKQLENNDGYIPLSDKSPAEIIYQRFNVSKKSFKMTIGSLYKKRLITITKDGITLVTKDQ